MVRQLRQLKVFYSPSHGSRGLTYSLFEKIYFYLCVCMMFGVYLCLWRSEEGIGFFGAGITDGCEPPGMGVGTEPESSRTETFLQPQGALF